MLYTVIFSLLLTLVIELTIYALMDKFSYKSFVAMFITNVILNVAMNLILIFINTKQEYLMWLMIMEIIVFIIESLVFYFVSKKRLWFSLLAAFTANISSLAIGYLLNYIYFPNTKEAFYVCASLFFVYILLLTVYVFLRFLSPGLFAKHHKRNDN